MEQEAVSVPGKERDRETKNTVNIHLIDTVQSTVLQMYFFEQYLNGEDVGELPTTFQQHYTSCFWNSPGHHVRGEKGIRYILKTDIISKIITIVSGDDIPESSILSVQAGQWQETKLMKHPQGTNT